MKSTTELFPILTSLNFDVDNGIELCGSDAAFYCELIEELYKDVLVRRHAALADPTILVRRDYAHLLKGTLQILGERRASAKARDLEQALRNDHPHENLTQELTADLDRMARTLGEVFDCPSSDDLRQLGS